MQCESGLFPNVVWRDPEREGRLYLTAAPAPSHGKLTFLQNGRNMQRQGVAELKLIPHSWTRGIHASCEQIRNNKF